MEEREPIDHVQPGALSKSFFVGSDLTDPSDDPEFYFRNYVVDGSASQSLIGIGTWSGVDRIRWEIDENLLIARKAYQLADGEDDKALPSKTPDGTVVAAFAITSQFDIQHGYNPTTGEENNVVEENTNDRPWNQRKYMRVDWSKNLVDSPMWDEMFMGKLFGNITVTAATHDESNTALPDAPDFDFDNGYFDITTKYYVEPADSTLIPGLPTCAVVGIFTGSTTYECDAQEATVRSSFLRVNPDDDFEPLELTNAPLDIVGNPAGIRYGSLVAGLVGGVKQGWDPGYGFTDSLYHRFAHIHNLWKASHQDASCDTNDDADANGSADQCENALTGWDGADGSQCDVDSNRCTIPYRDRELKTVGYWVNPEFPAELQDPIDDAGARKSEGAAEQVIHGWDQLLQASIAHAREVECRRTGGSRDACAAEFLDAEKEMVRYGGWLVDKAKDPTPVLTLCHNPVREYDDHQTCGATGKAARLGDIRKNFFAYWPYASRAPYGGIGNWGADPQTGEIHGAAAMIMGRSATYAAALQRDVIQVAIGDLAIEDITNGVPADNYVHQLQNGHAPESFTGEELAARVASIDTSHAMTTILPQKFDASDVAGQSNAWFNAQKQASLASDSLSQSQLEVDAYAKTLTDTPLEAGLVDSHWLVDAAALDPNGVTDEQTLDAVSPLRGLDPGNMRIISHDISTLLGARGICFHDTEAPVFGSVELQGLAKYFKAKYPDGEYDAKSRGEAIYNELWIEAFKGIAIHEVGHSLGLLHNFASSWDAQNFTPAYWQLRTHDGKSTASCEGSPRTGDLESADADSCMGPRYLDPETKDEQGLADESRPNIDYFGQTSVMEYSLERFGETIGLGQYDAHAMKALYGRVLETFDDADHGGFAVKDQNAFAPRLESQLIEQDRVVRSTAPFAGQKFAKPTHYTEVARMMKTFDPARCRDATDEEKAIAGWRLVHGKVCAPAPRDHAAWIDFENGNAETGNTSSAAVAWHTKKSAKTGGGMVRWFYRYGTSDNAYYHTNPGDAGADAFEVTKNTIDSFDAMYPWTYFRRGNREYIAESIPSRIASQTLERLRSYHWNAANRNAFFRSFGSDVFDEIANSDDWHRPEMVAETKGFDAFARILLMPEPGEYAAMPAQAGSTRQIFDVSTNGGFLVGAGDGRFVEEDFDSDPDGGGSWDYQHWMNHAGFGVEKTYAAMALADARPVLSTISRANYLDGRDSKISFRSDMPEAMDRLLGGILSEDWETVGMYVGNGSGAQTPSLLDLRSVDEPRRPDGARILFPNVGYKQQLGLVVFGNLYSRAGSDMQLANKMRVWLLGHDSSVEVPETQQIRFYDPAVGYTYVARRYGAETIDGKVADRGIASRMLAHANDLAAASYETEKDAEGNTVLDAFGAPVFSVDSSGLPIVLEDGRIAELTRYIGLLDAARQVGHKLGYGPIGGGEE